MKLNLDAQVFKLKDPRIQALKTGRLSLEHLVYTIRPYDFIILHSNTIYALTQIQFKALQDIQRPKDLSEASFKELLKDPPKVLSNKHVQTLHTIKTKLPKCSSCVYKKYKNIVRQIVLKYPQLKNKYLLDTLVSPIIQYPAVISEITPKVSLKIPRLFQKTNFTGRKPCLDCVEKHIGCAYIKGCETQQGYPEHFVLAVANLQQAYQQAPADFQPLKETLLFCIAKSKQDKHAFVPLSALLRLTTIARASVDAEAQALIQNVPDESFQLQLHIPETEILTDIPISNKQFIIADLDRLIALQYSEDADKKSAQWQGYMSSIADRILPFSKQVANTIRNRRLLFKAAPQLVQNTQYDCKDILQALKRSPKE